MSSSSHPRVTERRVIHTGRKFDFEQVNLAPPSESPVWREVVRHPGAVCILPVRSAGSGPQQPEIVLIRNHRFAIEGDSGAILWEIPAGTREPGEASEKTAARELIEETGYEAGRLQHLASFYTTPGMTDERMEAFLAEDLTHVGQRLEEDEHIDVHTVPLDRVFQMVDAGEITDGKTILTILLAARRGLLGDQDASRGTH